MTKKDQFELSDQGVCAYRTDYVYLIFGWLGRNRPITVAFAYFFVSFLGTYLIGFLSGQLHGLNGLPPMYDRSRLVDNFNMGFLAPAGAAVLCHLYNTIKKSTWLLHSDGVVPSSHSSEYRNILRKMDLHYNNRWVLGVIFIFSVCLNILIYYGKTDSWLGINGGITGIYGRFFVTVNYFILILVVYKSLITVIASGRILELPIVIRPMHPDRSGGLLPLGAMAIAVNYFLVIVLAFATLLLVFDDYAQRNTLFVVLLGSVYFLAPFSIFAALRKANRQMAKEKQLAMERLSHTFDKHYRLLTNGKKTDPYDLEVAQDISSIYELYEVVSNMPVWPFDVGSMIRFFSTVAIPFTLFVLDTIGFPDF